MLTYVINLERSADRRRHITAELASTGINYELITAIDGRSLDLSGPQLVRPGEPNQLHSPLWARTWNLPGVAGCTLSHLLVYQRIIASGSAQALVLEDDVVLMPDLPMVLDALPEHLSGAEVVLLNFDSHENLCQLSSRGTKPLPGERLLALPLDIAEPLSAAGYVITREACRRMLDRMTPARAKPDDWAFFYRQGVIDRLRCVTPMPVKKSPAFSSTILYDPGTLKARLRTLAFARRYTFLDRAAAWRRRRILHVGANCEVIDQPFREKPTRYDDAAQ